MVEEFEYGKTQKRIIFTDNEHRHAKLLIRLKHDGLKQSEFFRGIVTGYIEGDDRIQQYVHEISPQSKTRKTKSKKLLDEGRRRTQDFSASLSDDDVGDLFDLIAQEHPDL
jgi:hypothetical protein